MSFLGELRRRNVFRVGIAYLAAVWLLVQAADTILSNFEAPAWIIQALIFSAALGFPFAIALAWFYELTPEGIKAASEMQVTEGARFRGRKVDLAIIGCMGVAILFLVVDNYIWERLPDVAATSIAVLPFTDPNADRDNVSDDPGTRYLGDGISESLVMRLSRIPRLRVKSLAAIRDSDEDIQTLGRLLDVDAICIGRLVQRGDTLEISAELVDTSDGTVIWSDQYSRPASDLLSIESEISAEIARELRLQLSGEEEEALARAPTDNPEAYRLYLQGRYFWNRRTEEAFARSAELYRRAVDSDPGYALAWSGLADAHLMRFAWGIEPPSDAAPRVVAAAERAIELDPTLAEPHATLGYLMTLYEWDWEGAQREFLRAIELDNHYSTAHHWYAFYLLTIGDSSAAIDEILLARDWEPLSPIINAEVGYFYFCDRQYNQALEELQKARLLDPAYHSTVRNLVKAYALLGQREQAIATLEKWREIIADEFVDDAYGTQILPILGFEQEARAKYMAILEISRTRYITPGILAVVAASIGERDAAFAHFDQALEERSLVISWLRDPLLDNLRDDPRFAQIFERVGLEP